MLADNSDVVMGEDVLSTYYSTSSSSDSGSSPLTNSASSASSSISLTSGDRNEAGLLNFFRRRSWFGFGVTAENMKKKQDCDTVDEIMKCFRNNDVAGMEKFVHDEAQKSINDEITEKANDGMEMWWNDEEFAPPEPKAVETKVIPFRKNTPHPKKGITALPSRVLKAVRFDVENTPEDRETRPFTPLFTSTPKNFEVGSDSEDELVPLRECDSNTVAAPALNNTSSILLANCSVMNRLNKCHQETTNALCLPFNKNIYKICYDDTDEEEVPEEEVPVSEGPTPSRRTFVVQKEDSESISKTLSNRDQSFDQLDTSTDSSVILNLDDIEGYIQRLDDEISAANRFAQDRDTVRVMGAVQQARLLQQRFEQMSTAINEMFRKLPGGLELETLFKEEENEKNISAVFEDSQWRAQLGSEAGSFNRSQDL